MKKCSPHELDAAKVSSAEDILLSRFSWMGRHRAFVRECLAWQSEVTPRPAFYYRWHLPRLLATLELLEMAVRAFTSPDVLDIATYGPYALAMERFLEPVGRGVNWTRTSLSGEPFQIEHPSGATTVPTVPLFLDGKTPFPFNDCSFDIVILTEVIEHLTNHPQRTLVEINRVLRPGGFILITTPNVTSWKKILMLSRGDWCFDSPTFGADWGHRYEYSYYHIQELLRHAGFSSHLERTRDVYLDDPHGFRQAIQFAALTGSKICAGSIKEAAKLMTRSGSGLMFLWKKAEHCSTPPTDDELVRI